MWNPDTEKTLREGWAAGDSASQIATNLCHAFGHPFTRNMVIGKAHRLGLDRRASPIRRASA